MLNIRFQLLLLMISAMVFHGCSNATKPTGVTFKTETLKRIGAHGDNWCITWLADNSQMVAMDDGNWLEEDHRGFHTHLYRLIGDADDFTRRDVPAYPRFIWDGNGWFGYGLYSVDGNIYTTVSRTPAEDWDGPFLGMKLLKSPDNGNTWYNVNKDGKELYLAPDDEAREDTTSNGMFFIMEHGKTINGRTGYPFAACDFVQNGQDNSAAQDEFVYIYSPEGAQSNQLLLARVPSDRIENRASWQYFSGWNGETPTWANEIDHRAPVHEFPAKNKAGEYFGWYSWQPSVVWNSGLQLYIMVNGGTYAGHGLTNAPEDYTDRWMHTKTGSLGFWYSKNPYGPWTQFYYTDYWTVDDDNNRTYQPKLSPKWISKDGREMVLIWSDAMKNEEGKSHTINYLWNQMHFTIKMDD